MKPLYQKQIIFKNDIGCVVDFLELEKAIIWYSKHPVFPNKKIFMHGLYPAISIGKQKLHIHRLLMFYWENRILESNENVHHINENKLDSTRRNLTIINQGEHQSLHNKGKTLTEEHKILISENNKLRKGIPHKPSRPDVLLEDIKKYLDLGYSILKISKTLNCDWSTIKKRIHDNPDLLS